MKPRTIVVSQMGCRLTRAVGGTLPQPPPSSPWPPRTTSLPSRASTESAPALPQITSSRVVPKSVSSAAVPVIVHSVRAPATLPAMLLANAGATIRQTADAETKSARSLTVPLLLVGVAECYDARTRGSPLVEGVRSRDRAARAQGILRLADVLRRPRLPMELQGLAEHRLSLLRAAVGEQLQPAAVPRVGGRGFASKALERSGRCSRIAAKDRERCLRPRAVLGGLECPFKVVRSAEIACQPRDVHQGVGERVLLDELDPLLPEVEDLGQQRRRFLRPARGVE